MYENYKKEIKKDKIKLGRSRKYFRHNASGIYLSAPLYFFLFLTKTKK